MAFKVLLTRRDGSQVWMSDVVSTPTPKLGDVLRFQLDGGPVVARVDMIGKGWIPPEPGFVEKVSATEL
jgi:hypothetical protein